MQALSKTSYQILVMLSHSAIIYQFLQRCSHLAQYTHFKISSITLQCCHHLRLVEIQMVRAG